jgi:hypothetical protein
MNKKPKFLFIIAAASSVVAAFLVLRLSTLSRPVAANDQQSKVSESGVSPSPTPPATTPDPDPSAQIATVKPLKDEDVKLAILTATNKNVLPTEWLGKTPEIEILDETTVQASQSDQRTVNVKCYAAVGTNAHPHERDERIFVLKFRVRPGSDASWEIDDHRGPWVLKSFVIFRARLPGLAKPRSSPGQNENIVSPQNPKSTTLAQQLLLLIRRSLSNAGRDDRGSEVCPYFDDDVKWQEMTSRVPEVIVEEAAGKRFILHNANAEEPVVEDEMGNPVQNDTEQFRESLSQFWELFHHETRVIVACEIREGTGAEDAPKVIVKLLK